jgi:uncharacterized protein (DUF2147 family)
MKFRATLALAFLAAATAGAHAEPTATGMWEAVDKNGKPEAWFLFTQKNEVYSARLIKGFPKEGEEDKPVKTICDVCPGKKKGAHIMGLTLFWGMKRDGINYNDGSVLDPRDGSIYHAKMWFDPDSDGSVLHVRGYLGISVFGQTQDWKRLPDDAMKKEDIPKEILAGDDAPPDKTKHVADKGKHKKDKAKTDKIDPSPAEAEAPAPDATPADKAQ